MKEDIFIDKFDGNDDAERDDSIKNNNRINNLLEQQLNKERQSKKGLEQQLRVSLRCFRIVLLLTGQFHRRSSR